MIDIIVYSIIGVIVLLIVLLIYLISNLGQSKTVKKKKNNYSRRSSNDPLRLILIHSVELPKQIESIARSGIPSIVSQIQRVYENLDYKINIQEFIKPQWHTWQVSMLLKMYKSGLSIHISNPEALFPEDLHNKSDRDLRQIMNDIMVKYKRDVETYRNRDFLSCDLIWTGRDVGIILYFLSKYQTFKEELR